MQAKGNPPAKWERLILPLILSMKQGPRAGRKSGPKEWRGAGHCFFGENRKESSGWHYGKIGWSRGQEKVFTLEARTV